MPNEPIDLPARARAGAALFITGTDTGVGKTFVSAALLRALGRAGVRALGMKPVASGSERTDAGWRNEDALALQSAGFTTVDYALVNPYALEEPTAPEIAAMHAGVWIDVEALDRAYAALSAKADTVVVEGVGGWLAPLSDTLWQADLARRWRLPVLLVVGVRLGCINHSLLTLQTLRHDGFDVLGWVGNRVDPQMLFADETLAILRERLAIPCLGVMPFAADETQAADALLPAVELLRRRRGEAGG